MNLKFWKKKAPANGKDGETDDDRTVAIPREAEAAEAREEAGAGPGLLARVRKALSALRTPRESSSEADGAKAEAPVTEQSAADDRRDIEAPVIVPVRKPNLKKRLIIGAALGAVVLLLAGIGFTAWKLLAPKPEEPHMAPETAAHDTASPAPRPAGDAAMQAQIEALQQRNAQMQRELEALKKTGQGDTPATAPIKNSPSQPASGDVLLFTGKDTKASAAALKQAIEEMNAASGGAKPRKPAP